MSLRFPRAFALGAFACLAIVAVCAISLHFGADPAGLHGVGMFTASAVAVTGADIEKLALDLKAAADEVKQKAELTNTELKNLGKITDETKKAADEAMIKHNALSARMSEIEQKMVRQPGAPERAKSNGEVVTESDAFKSYVDRGGKGRISFPVKAIISSLTTDANGSAGDLIVNDRQPGIIAPPQRKMTIRDLMAPGRTASNAIEYIVETGFTNNAATMSETAGNTKPQSEIKFDIRVQAVTTIAHFVLATRQILSDVPRLQSYIDGRLRYGLMYVEENQLLNGGGTGTDLKGIYTSATQYLAPITPTSAGNLTKIDVIRLAMLQAFLAEYPASGIVMNPADWADIELTKTDDGAYLFANPQGGSEARLWRLPVVETQAMTIDRFLVGAFNMASQIFDREDASVEISTEDSDNFRKNLVTILAEERLASAVYRPEAFIKGTFAAALAA